MKPMICIESIADASISYTFDMGGGDTTSEVMKRLKLFVHGVSDYEIDKYVNKLSATSYIVC